MSAIINMLDAANNSRHLGEKGHAQLNHISLHKKNSINVTITDEDLKESMVQLSFQLVRKADINENFREKFREILQEVKGIGDDSTNTSTSTINWTTILCKLIAHTRDIIDGKGEYNLSYMLIYEMYQVFPEMAKSLLSKFVFLEIDGQSVHPYGSWKDIKYFCKYCKDQDKNNKFSSSNDIIQFALSLLLDQLKKDSIGTSDSSDATSLSLAARWCPREKCARFGWIFTELSKMWFSEYMESAKSGEQKKKAELKCKMEFRKLLSGLNKKLDTIQIKQCGNEWASINHNKTTSITGMKQQKALLNLNKKGEQRSLFYDRIECAINYTNYLESLKEKGVEVKGKRIGLNDFTVQAIKLIQDGSKSLEKDILNSQWRDNASQTGNIGKIVAMVDTSGSMQGDPLHSAIALGIRTSEKSVLGKRVLTFSERSDWHDLTTCDTFTDSVASLMYADWGGTTNFYSAFDKILDAIVAAKMQPFETEDMILAVFSDMQIDMATSESSEGNNNTTNRMNIMFEVMEKKYVDAGMKIWGEPFKLPHILFWNLTQTSGFPVSYKQKNVTMFSGFSPALLNNFCNKGIDFLKNVDPWTMFLESLDKPRYASL